MGGSYTYQQLPSPTAIRILYLLPGNKHDLLSCQLSTCETTAQPDQHSLVQHQPIPSFEAISYVWGDPEAQEGILCEGKTMMLHQSLANVLRRVRYRHKIRLLWADAVCINQQDNIERGHQVKLMASIYSRASGTLFYITP
ncbi:heterokaryon incompatibility protein-domain-containing protein, partial [Tricladium varicosporioides]